MRRNGPAANKFSCTRPEVINDAILNGNNTPRYESRNFSFRFSILVSISVLGRNTKILMNNKAKLKVLYKKWWKLGTVHSYRNKWTKNSNGLLIKLEKQALKEYNIERLTASCWTASFPLRKTDQSREKNVTSITRGRNSKAISITFDFGKHYNKVWFQIYFNEKFAVVFCARARGESPR